MAKKAERKKRVGIPKDETAEQRTKRLTEFRVNRACANIEAIAPLAASPYTLTKEQKEEVLTTLAEAVRLVNVAFTTGVTAQAGFTLGK